ncbi:MAG TPA: aminodeoxychorismate synthase component I [Bordetella sp.]|jgi:para-aminobenzoate synthetase component 1|nr:aminodeoxychorismate synthase component I [Bordetella sp.]
MFCRFEDRLAGRALQLDGARDRIEARTPAELQPALDAIEAARRQGRWVALLLDFELGEWLLPLPARDEAARAFDRYVGAATAEVREPDLAELPRPRLRALVFDAAHHEAPWQAGTATPGGIGASGGAGEIGGIGGVEGISGIGNITPRLDQASYLAHIEAIRRGIGHGAFYQINYTMPLDMRVRGDRRALYTRIAQRNPVAHAAYIEDGGQTVLSFSPELFVRRRGDLLTTRPMKGTAPRDADPERDQALGQALLASEKNRAENLMIVDLLRNDLGRLAEPGSVHVDALFTLERYPTVWTMTSTVTARAPHASLDDVLHALFPCGSVTGAPKIAALAHIRHAEIAPRGLYCGSIGWLAPDGDFSLNVAIRTLVVDAGGHGVYGVGGGIVHDSEPDAEWQECLWKARILDPELDKP